DQRGVIEKIVAGELDANENQVMSIAAELLAAESELRNFIAQRSGAVIGGLTDSDSPIPTAEFRQVLSTVIVEGLKNFTVAKEAILSFISGIGQEEQLDIILQKLEEVRGITMMMPMSQIESQINKLMLYVRVALRDNHHRPEAEEQDVVADVVTAIEYYLEAVAEGRPGVEAGLRAGDIAAEKLIAVSDKYTAMGGGDILLEETVADDGVAATPDAAVSSVPDKTHDTKKNPPKSQKPAVQHAPESHEKKTEYDIIGDDADPEIVEIFIEEALEVLEDLHRCLPAWRSNQDDDESLSTVRRSFHTLKGSGRLIGADLIGEFSWKVENMLNRVIENKIQTSDVMFEKMEEALAVLPQLIEQINGNREPVTNVRELMNIFDALSEGRDPAIEIAAEHLASAPDIDDSESQPVTLSIVDNAPDEHRQFADQIVSDQVDDLQVDITQDDDVEIELIDTSAEEPEDAISVIDVESLDIELETPEAGAHQPYEEEVVELAFEQPAEDSIEIDFSEAGQAVDASQISDEDRRDTPGQSGIDDELDIEIDEDTYPDEDDRNVPEQMDPVLFRIYYDESQSHLDKVESMLSAHHNGAVQLHANKDLVRAFHTLYGSARTAEIEPIAELCGATEKYIKAREEASDINIPDLAIGLITEVKDDVRSKLVELKNGGMPSSNKQLLDRIIKLVQNELQSQLQESSRKSVHDYSRSAAKETPPAVIQEDEFSIEMDELAGKPARQEPQPAAAQAPEPAPAPASTGSQVSHSISYSEIDGELIDIFLEEAEEILESCESGVLGVIEDPDDNENLQNLQRHMHTLKGGARMAELTPVGDLTHNLETLLITLTEGSLKPDKLLFDTLHESLDVLTSMLSSVKQRQPIEVADELNAQIESIMRGEVPEKRSVERFDVDIEQLADLEPEVNPERRATDKIASNDDAKNDSQFQPGRRASDEQIDPAWGERATDASSRDSQELVRVRADLLNSLVNYAGEVNIYHARMGKQVTDIGYNLSELEQTVVRLKDQLRNLEIETELQIRSNYEKVADQYGADFDPLEMDRYSTLQQLSRSLSETAGDVESINGILGEIVRDSETLLLQESRVSTDLQEGLMRTRMVRFGGLGTRLRRIVRQTAKELGKDVELEIKGDTSEVDRTVLDRIIAPLEHMLRNAVAHGIEKPNDRVESGKPESGTITINVERQAADVIIRVEDDGAGINTATIRKKAVERGLMDADSTLTDHDVLQFILKSGFSTATEVTQVSGRGVGMDVVGSEIKQLGGSFEIDTKLGKGTSFKVRLPLTLAINQALLVNAADDVYAVPLASIEGVVRITGAELQSFYNSGQLDYEFNGVLYELKHLGRLLTGEQADYSGQHRLFPVLLAKVGDQHYALHVDDLIGRREIVVKPVGLQIGLVRGIAGATILADGRVVLILEMSALVVGESLFKQVREDVVVPVPVAETTVMVVDDSITIRKVTERILLRNGIKVLLAKDGVDATNILQDHKPDLMLLDIEMPRMDGFELATYIRNDDRLKDLPIIMITSRTGTKHKEKAMEIGVNQYLGKPYQEEELMKNINDLLFANG
ncbi:MAG: Hpt domain-containing protein, partial [Gammaproteobacteria bacterium]